MEELPQSRPILIFVLSGKGGVGKTLLSLLIADLFDLNDHTLDVIQIDDQNRLARSLARNVVTIDIALLKKARKDPGALMRAFAPFYDLAAAMHKDERSLLVDIGATQQHLLLDYAALTELNDDLVEFGTRARAFIPIVADPESIEQGLRQIAALQRVLPSVSPCIVLNQRDGKFEDISATSVAGELYHSALKPILATIPHIVMPRIEAGSWAYFERQHCRLIDVVGFNVQTAMAVSGLSRPEAKLARGDVAAWVQVMEEALRPLFPFMGEEGGHE
jgi:hypothetical protein